MKAHGLFVLFAVAACGGGPGAPASPDSGTPPDGGVHADAGSGGHTDGGSVDAGPTADGGSSLVLRTVQDVDGASRKVAVCPSAVPATLAQPTAGEWPMFKRDASHRGEATGLAGSIGMAGPCLKWSRRVTADNTRGNSGVLIARIASVPTVFVSVNGGEGDGGTYRGNAPGTVYALDARSRGTAAILWSRRLEGTYPLGGAPVSSFSSQADIYAPLLLDLDGDGRRELLVNATNQRYVFAIRTEAEGNDPAGSFRWVFRYDEEIATSEAAPAAADLDCDGKPEIVIGTGFFNQSNDITQPGAPVYVIDGPTGTRKGTPFVSARRYDRDMMCGNTNKIDSSSPAVAIVDGVPTVLVGSWDGSLYGLQWDPLARELFARYRHDLPDNGRSDVCRIAKIRGSATVGQMLPAGGTQVAFGYMYEAVGVNSDYDFERSRLRILNLDGAGFSLAQPDLEVTGWKSTPSLADLRIDHGGAPRLGLAGGRFKGLYATRPNGAGTLQEVAFNPDVGNANENWGGNRSSPAVGDLDGDGLNEIVYGIEGEDLVGRPSAPGVRAYNTQGTLLWEYPKPADRPAGYRGVAAAPALGDLGDNRLGVVYLGLDGVVVALDGACP